MILRAYSVRVMPKSMGESSAIPFLRRCREELAAAQNVLLSKEAVIARLTKELAETRARMSDLRGGSSVERWVPVPLPAVTRAGTSGHTPWTLGL